MNNLEEMRVPLAFAIGLICFLAVGIPRWVKNYRISKIIKYGKLNQTYIRATMVPGSFRRHNEQYDNGTNREYCVADYAYEVNGRTKQYHFIGTSCPSYIPMYYYQAKNDVHCENELENRQQLWQIPFIVGLVVIVVFLLITRSLSS